MTFYKVERDATLEDRTSLTARVDELQTAAAAAALDAAKTQASMAALQEKCSTLEAALVKAEERATSAQDLFAGFMQDLKTRSVFD